MKKRMLCFALILIMCVSLFPVIVVHAVSITDSNVFVKQETGKECTLAANVMMLRRKAILDGDANWTDITSGALRSQTWSSKGMSWSYTYSGMKTYSYGMKSELGLYPGEVSKKKDYFISNLETHPEGIVIYVHYNQSYLHAVLLTDYDSSTDTFYCADPANSVASGRIKLTSSLLPQYIKNSGYNNTGLSDQDLVIGYIQQTWMITGGASSVNPGSSESAQHSSPPASPTNLKAEKGSATNTAQLSWSLSAGAASYEVQYYSPSAGTWKIDSDYKTKTATSYISTGLSLYASYDFRVRAVNSAGVSNWAMVTYSTKAYGTVTVRYNANGGNGAPASHSVTKDSSGVAKFTLSSTMPARAGYTFLGWRLENSASYGIDKSGQPITFNTGAAASNTTLTYYAQWEAVKTTTPPDDGGPGITSINRNMTVNVGAGSTLRFCSTVSTAENAHMGSISNGTTVYVYGFTTQKYEDRVWAKISYNGTIGWVNSAWLQDEQAPSQEIQITSANRNMTVNVGAGSTLRFCSTVSTAESAHIGSIPNGAAVYVYGFTTQMYEDRIWAKISYNGTVGWVNSAWLK